MDFNFFFKFKAALRLRLGSRGTNMKIRLTYVQGWMSYKLFDQDSQYKANHNKITRLLVVVRIIKFPLSKWQWISSTSQNKGTYADLTIIKLVNNIFGRNPVKHKSFISSSSVGFLLFI